MEINEEKLTCLLYLLMRDEIPTGVIPGIILSLSANSGFVFSNKHLEKYSKELIERLK